MTFTWGKGIYDLTGVPKRLSCTHPHRATGQLCPLVGSTGSGCLPPGMWYLHSLVMDGDVLPKVRMALAWWLTAGRTHLEKT